MKKLLFATLFTTIGFCKISSAQTYDAVIKTDSGTIVIELYDKTPKHRDNFIKLAKEGFYDSLLFHRVIPGFMIQGGDQNSKNAAPGAMLGNGDLGYKVPAEFVDDYIHQKGALAAARDNNPEKSSSASQFYIVEGKPYSEDELNMISARTRKQYTPEQKKIYETEGGTPFLDNNYTVYGQVLSGMDVVHKIISVPKNGSDRPDVDQHIISVKIINHGTYNIKANKLHKAIKKSKH